MTTHEQLKEMVDNCGLSIYKLSHVINVNESTIKRILKTGNASQKSDKAVKLAYKKWKVGALDDAIEYAKQPKDVAYPSHYAIFETMEAEDNYILEQLVELIEKMGSKRYPDADDFQRHNAHRLRIMITQRADHSYYRALLFPVVEHKPKAERKPRHKWLIGHDYRIASRIQQYGECATVIWR